MRPAEKARQQLKGHWPAAATVELLVFIARLLPALALVVGYPFAAPFLRPLPYAGYWLPAAPIAALLIVDWLLLSPLLLGRQFFYWDIAQDRPATAGHLLAGWRSYGRALGWRFGRFWRRLFWSVLFYAPSVLLTGCAGALRQRAASPLIDTCLLLCTLGGPFLLLAGLIAAEACMLRYLAVPGLLAASGGRLRVRGLFGRSRRITRHKSGDLFGLTAGFAGWALTCLLLLPGLYVLPLFHTTRMRVVRRYLLEYDPNPQPKAKKTAKKRAKRSEGEWEPALLDKPAGDPVVTFYLKSAEHPPG